MNSRSRISRALAIIHESITLPLLLIQFSSQAIIEVMFLMIFTSWISSLLITQMFIAGIAFVHACIRSTRNTRAFPAMHYATIIIFVINLSLAGAVRDDQPKISVYDNVLPDVQRWNHTS